MKSKHLCLDIFVFRDVHNLSGGFFYVACRAVLFDKLKQRLFTADTYATKNVVGDDISLSFENGYVIRLPKSSSLSNHLLFSPINMGSPFEVISR